LLRQQTLYGVEIASRCVVDGGFNAAAETDIADPEKNGERRRQNDTI
jgi:hypothetical protein